MHFQKVHELLAKVHELLPKVHELFESASKVRQKCTTSASKVHQKCIQSELKVHQKRTKSASNIWHFSYLRFTCDVLGFVQMRTCEHKKKLLLFCLKPLCLRFACDVLGSVQMLPMTFVKTALNQPTKFARHLAKQCVKRYSSLCWPEIFQQFN